MLKPHRHAIKRLSDMPAAFRRLCVETITPSTVSVGSTTQPPLGGCVLKHLNRLLMQQHKIPAAFRRLCVETGAYAPPLSNRGASRL